MLRYRTEVVISPDRYVCLQLPGHMPEGRATVMVYFPTAGDGQGGGDDLDPDREDIEWWDEFEGDHASDP